MQPRRHSLLVPDLIDQKQKHEIVFYDWGSVDASEVVVCVHGLTRNAHDFDALAATLADRGKRVFSLNMAGRGESAWLANPMNYNYAQYAADCLAVMDNFHLRGVEWVGTSMGGIIGMIIAANHASRIKKMVLNDVGTFLSKEALKRIYDPAIALPLAATSENFTKIDDINLTALWEEITIPVLILHGELSDVLDTPTVSAMRSTNTAAQAVTIHGVGHAPALNSSDQIAIVVNWLARNSLLPPGL